MQQAKSWPDRGIEQAAELLDVVNEDELAWFLRRLADELAPARHGRLPVARRRALLGELARIATRTLPTLCSFVEGDRPTGHPSSPVTTAAHVYGLELEGLSSEDRDFEIARHFVRFAEAAIDAAIDDRGTSTLADPVDAAVASAARGHAPGLLARRAQAAAPGRPAGVPPSGCRCHGVEPQTNPTTRGVPHV